jgi:hypothetical protein
MNLRAFPISPPDKPLAIDGSIPAPVPLTGWTWFPPYCDSEKLAVVTDRGQFGLFGIKQAGNLDAPIFVFPPVPYMIPEAQAPARGQIIYGDESSFWFLARGALHHLQVGFDVEHGLKLVSRGKRATLGEPLQAAQVNARADTALVVTQAAASASCRATAIDLRTGDIRWQRQLGVIAQRDPIRLGEAIVLMDQDGAIFQIGAKPLAGAASSEWLLDDRWLVAPPLTDVLDAGYFFPAKDGLSVYGVLTVQGERGPRLAVRRYTPGQPLKERFATLPARLAGNPIVLGGSVIVPLKNGMLYRLALDSDKPLEAGPTWRGERVREPGPCHVAALNDDEFVASDGHRTVNRWRWTAVGDEFGKRGSITLGERVAAPPILVEGNRLIVADARARITMWDAERLVANAQPLRAWLPSEKGKIPPGTLTAGPFLLHIPNKGKWRVCYVIDGANVVLISPDADVPLWVAKNADRIPGSAVLGRPRIEGDKLLITDRMGMLLALDTESGEVAGDSIQLKGNAAPSSAAVVLEKKMVLVPLTDGTLHLEFVGAKKPEKLPIFIFPLAPSGIPVPLPVE